MIAIDGTTVFKANDGVFYGDVSDVAGTYSCTEGALDGDRTTVDDISTDQYNACGLELHAIAGDTCTLS